MRTVRITELDDWQECAALWHFRHELRLRRVPEDTSDARGPMLSGSAIHAGIEAGFLAPPGAVRVERAREAALLYLSAYGTARERERFEPGVLRALVGVPLELWSVELPQVELKLVQTMGDIEIVGKPDLWYVDTFGAVVVDFKSTGKAPGDVLERHMRWSMQLPRYALLVSRTLSLPVYYQYIVLGTQGKHAVGTLQLLSERTAELVLDHMLAQAALVGSHTAHSFGARCDWCEFQDICEGYLTNADTASIMSTRYERRRAHDGQTV